MNTKSYDMASRDDDTTEGPDFRSRIGRMFIENHQKLALGVVVLAAKKYFVARDAGDEIEVERSVEQMRLGVLYHTQLSDLNGEYDPSCSIEALKLMQSFIDPQTGCLHAPI